MSQKYYVYIATNHPRNTVLYTGVTRGLIKRAGEHQEKIFANSFTGKYNVNKIVYYEIYDDIRKAIFREKQIKAGSRNKKLELIKEQNPEWNDILSSCHCSR
jgi:putative endonuclease